MLFDPQTSYLILRYKNNKMAKPDRYISNSKYDLNCQFVRIWTCLMTFFSKFDHFCSVSVSFLWIFLENEHLMIWNWLNQKSHKTNFKRKTFSDDEQIKIICSYICIPDRFKKVHRLHWWYLMTQIEMSFEKKKSLGFVYLISS